jgi:Meiotically up-regulated gene 113
MTTFHTFCRPLASTQQNEQLKSELKKITLTIEQLSVLNLQEEIARLNGEKDKVVLEIEQAKKSKEEVERNIEQEIQSINLRKNICLESTEEAQSTLEKINKSILSAQNQLARIKPLYKSIQYTIDKYYKEFAERETYKLSNDQLSLLDDLSPTVTLKLHCMDVKDLRKAYNDNEKIIKSTLQKYEARYTTKTNTALYKLMVIALQAELQNILYNLNYGKLEDSIQNVKDITKKYMQIATDGNQTIASTMVKFIGEIEYLFIQAVMIEFEYYVKKEQIKQEQLAIREQMRQEAEERKALEQQKQQIEKEEVKYKKEIESVRIQLTTASDDEKISQLNARIADLEFQLTQVEHKKEEIICLQNGKAGNVYIISNLGAFGDRMFKIGMTRRLDPQDRINELGDASVPFRFDVHSFIFSDDAVALEQRLHTILNDKRVNKVNLRKEFFRVSIDELEELVLNIESTAEFNKTMLAEEYYQTLSWDDELGMEVDNACAS